MVSAFSLCLLTIGLTAVSSQVIAESDGESFDAPLSERRTFSKGKPVKFFPLVKKHKKFGGLLPHVFGKTSYAEAPVIHETPAHPPLYKFHRYQGIEVKPVSDVVTPEVVESHSSSFHGDYAPSFASDYSPVFHHDHDKPVFHESHGYPSFPEPSFSASPAPAFAPLPPVTPIKLISFVPVPSPQIAPVFPALPFSLPSPPAFPSVHLARPAPAPVLPPAPAPSPLPVFTSFPAPQPPAHIIHSFPIKIQAPAPSPVPILSLAPQPSPLPQIAFPAPSPAPVFSAFPSPSPAPILPALPTPAPTFVTPEPQFPYPPSGTPLPSYIKDISLSDIDIKDTPLPTAEPVEIHHVDDHTKTFDAGLLEKFKGWKADKANAALSHFTHFKPKPSIQPITIPHNKLPLEIPASQAPVYPPLQFSAPIHPLPVAPAPVFFHPTAQFFPGSKYESFPPNAIESPPPLFNSYGAPIPHDSYSPPHFSHDRVAPAASEEDPAVLPPPADHKQEQKPNQQAQQQIQQQQQQFQPQSLISHDRPIYVPEGNNKTVKEEIQEVLPERDNYQQPEPETTADNVSSNYPNHKE